MAGGSITLFFILLSHYDLLPAIFTYNFVCRDLLVVFAFLAFLSSTVTVENAIPVISFQPTSVDKTNSTCHDRIYHLHTNCQRSNDK